MTPRTCAMLAAIVRCLPIAKSCLLNGEARRCCQGTPGGALRTFGARITKVALVFLLLAVIAAPAFARVFTLRPGGSSMDDASRFGGKAVYGGRFLVNGSPCSLQLIQMTDSPDLAMRRIEGALGGGLAWGRARGGTVTGSWADGRAMRRLLLTPGGSGGGSLLFVLDVRDGADPSREPPRWPAGLPEVSSSQTPTWVIEHPEARFLLAAATVDCPAMDALLEGCKARFEESGWQAQSGTSGGERRGGDSGFALFTKKGKTCWMQARAGPTSRQATVVFLIKTD